MSSLAEAIDHVVIGTPDLEAARAEFVELGFQVSPHAIHEKFGTDNYLVVLEDSYIELLGITGRPAGSRTSLDILEPCIAHGGGIPMLALAADDMAAKRQRLHALGVQPREPISWSRPAETPDGLRTASFTTMFLGGPLLPGFSVFYCKQHTVDFVRHPAWRRHPNGANELLGVTRYSDANLNGALGQLERLGGVRATDGSVELTFGNHSLIYRVASAGRSELHVGAGTGVGAPIRHDLTSVHGVALVLHRALRSSEGG